MSIGVMIRQDPASPNYVDDIVAQARVAHHYGVRHLWFGQTFDLDAITVSAMVATAVPDVHVGTAAVSITARHPLSVSSTAQTAQAAAHGKFSLGIGLGGHAAERRALGLSCPDVVGRLREYLTVLRTVFVEGAVDFDGKQLTARVPSQGPLSGAVAGGAPMPVYVAAMGPQALAVTGQLGDGTIPFLAGPTTIAEFIKPTIDKEANQAGRPQPRIIAMVPVSVTNDRDGALNAARASLAGYDNVPSYRRVLDREGLSSAADLAVVGDADTVAAALDRYRIAGASDLILYPLQSDPIGLQQIWSLAGTM